MEKTTCLVLGTISIVCNIGIKIIENTLKHDM